MVGAQKGGFIGWPKGGRSPGRGEAKGVLTISRFFPSPAPIFAFLSSLGVFSLNLGGDFEAPGPEMCTFGVLGLSCENPGGPATMPCTFEGPRASKHHQNSTTRPPREREKKRAKMEAGKGTQKREILGGSARFRGGRSW